MTVENILITGITGQDGIFLTSHLATFRNKYNIIGISRGKEKKFFKNLNIVNSETNTDSITILNVNLNNKQDVKKLLEDINPVQIYNLTGPSSVNESIIKPEIYKEIPIFFNNLTTSCIELNIQPNFFQASSSEMFSIDNALPLNEDSNYNPRNPYSIAKYEVFQSVSSLRDKYGWNIKTGIMFNHESEFRGDGFLFTKVIDAAIAIKNNQQSMLKVGSLSYVRDWSFAGDIVNAMALINSYENNSDLVIGSGIGTSIKDVLDISFSHLGLNYKKFVEVDQSLLRDGDPEKIISDPKKLKNKLGWYPQYDVENLIHRCIDFKIE